ncbi:MAG: hypothetical protein H0X66_20710 [Verrucomicrobia bacterium]|nr:hypothetical protein [Verrucomicrobiota bacterium]
MQTNDLLRVLTREGVLLNVSVRYWRGCKKLRAEDLGLNPDDVSNRLISLGHKRLLPKEATAGLSLVESRTHALVEANTFPFLNGLAHFLPNQKLEEITAKLQELEEEFWRAKREFLGHYAKLRESASEEWRSMAERLVVDPERLVSTIEVSFPTPERMDRFFGFDTQLFQIAVPERLGLDVVSLADQQNVIKARQQAAQAASRKIREDVESFVAECAATLREQTAVLCSDMLESISTSETGVHQKTLNRLIRFIDQFKQMNFVNDAEMEHQLEAVRKDLLGKTAEEYRDSASSRTRLVAGLSRLRDHARELAKNDTTELVQRFGELGRRKFHLAA